MALLGRNNPIGIAFGALIFAFLSQQATLLNILAGISPDIIAVTQGVIVMAVVIAYEIVRRYRVRAGAGAGRHRARRTTTQPGPGGGGGMSVAAHTAGCPGGSAAGRRRRARARRRRFALYAALGFVALCVVRVVTGADQLTSSGTLTVALTATMPIALAGLGGLWSERAGVVNIGLEGQMIMGTLGARLLRLPLRRGRRRPRRGGLRVPSAACCTPSPRSSFGVDHIVSGVAINIIAAGVSGFLAETWFSDLEGGGPTQSPPLAHARPRSTSPSSSDPANTLEGKHWFLISDLAGVVEMFTKTSPR